MDIKIQNRQQSARHSVTTNLARGDHELAQDRSRKVTGPRGPGTASRLIPVSGTSNSLNPSRSLVVAFQKAPVPV